MATFERAPSLNEGRVAALDRAELIATSVWSSDN
jgi:hypothetical protein